MGGFPRAAVRPPPQVPALAAFVALGALAGWALVPRGARAGEGAVCLRVAGGPAPAGPEAARLAARRWLDAPVDVAVRAGAGPAVHVVRTRAELGAGVAFARLPALGSTRPGERPCVDAPMPATVDRVRVARAVLAVADAVDVAPRDARWDLGRGAPVDGRDGARLDVASALARVEAAIVAGADAVELDAAVLPPARSASSLATTEAGAVLGAYAVPLGGDEARAGRAGEIAARLDGLVLAPGEVLDVGAAGGVGAGDEDAALAVATAVHAAAALAALDLKERHAPPRAAGGHAGVDAVAGAGRALRVGNGLGEVVVLAARVAGGAVVAEVRGRARTRAVAVERAVVEVLPAPERVIEDDRLPRGTRLLTQAGAAGLVVTTARVVRGPGGVVARDGWRDTYPARPRVWRAGTGALTLGPARRDLPPPPAPEVRLPRLAVE